MTRDKDTAVGLPVEKTRLSQRGGQPNVATSKVEDRLTQSGQYAEGREIGIMLSPAQIEHVVGEALDNGLPSIAALLAGLHAGQTVSRVSLEEKYRAELSEARLSHSLLRGLLVLSLLIDGTERGVSDIARRLDLSISTAHRYVSTLLAFGLVEQDQLTRKYRLATALSTEPPQRPTRQSEPR